MPVASSAQVAWEVRRAEHCTREKHWYAQSSFGKLSLIPRLISSTGLHEKEPGYEAMADQMQKEIYVEHTYFQHCILESKELQRETLLLAAVIEYSVTINRKSQKRFISVVKLCNRFHHLHPVYIVIMVKYCKAAQCLLPQYGKMEVYVLHNSEILARA